MGSTSQRLYQKNRLYLWIRTKQEQRWNMESKLDANPVNDPACTNYGAGSFLLSELASKENNDREDR